MNTIEQKFPLLEEWWLNCFIKAHFVLVRWYEERVATLQICVCMLQLLVFFFFHLLIVVLLFFAHRKNMSISRSASCAGSLCEIRVIKINRHIARLVLLFFMSVKFIGKILLQLHYITVRSEDEYTIHIFGVLWVEQIQ